MGQQRSEGLKEFLDPFLRDLPTAFCLLAATIRYRKAFHDSSNGDLTAIANEVVAKKAAFLKAGFSEDEARGIIDFVRRKDTEGKLKDLEQELATKGGQ